MDFHSDIQGTDIPITHPIIGVGDMEDITIPGAHTGIGEGIHPGMEAPTGRGTTMDIIMDIMTGIMGMQLHTDMDIWTAGTIMDTDHPPTPPIRVRRALLITIPDTGAGLPIPGAPAVQNREMVLAE